ncbi:hypothetical protein ACWCV9_33235, partial [Streptomyces sp. NPDC001606]
RDEGSDHGRGDDDERGNERGNERGHDEPRGGMHTGGGALATVRGHDRGSDSDRGEDSDHGRDEGSDHGRGDDDERGNERGNERGHDEPRGGVHTGGGALATVRGHDRDSDSDRGEDSDHGRDEGSDHGRDNDSDHGRGNDDDHGNERGHDEPRGGVHTGGGALATVLRGDDWGSGSGRDDSRFDPDSYRDKGHGSGRGQDDYGSDHDRPHGGMHTGGGALANPGVTAGGIGVLLVGAAGAYALRRKKAAQPAS